MQTVEVKMAEVVLHMPQPLIETLQQMAQYRRCSVESLIVRLVADNAMVQKYFTRATLALWEPEG